MIFDRRFYAQLQRTLELITSPVYVLDERGHRLLPDNDDGAAPQLPQEVSLSTEAAAVGEYTFMRTDTSPALIVCAAGSDDAARDRVTLLGQLITALAQSETKHTDIEDVYRALLQRRLDQAELEQYIHDFQLEPERLRTVVVISLPNADAAAVHDILTDVVQNVNGDRVAEMDRHTCAIVAPLDDDQTFDELEQLCLAIQNTLIDETGVKALIGIGEPRKNIAELYESYAEGKTAVKIGQTYSGAQSDVFIYRNMLLQRLLAEIPEEVSRKYCAILFNKKTARLLNEEMLGTIERFFENNLNLSETARQLYIHRNTLVYRLDKLQRATGLDLRDFDDAVTFQIMMLISRGLNDEALFNARPH